MRIFFAGPLTDLTNKDQIKAFYRRMADVAEQNAFDHYWAFLNGTDPELNPDVPPEVVYDTDIRELAKSDLMIVYLGEPTTGTGQEIEYAKEHNIPVYLLYEKGKRITRMVLGSPNIKGKFEFISEEDALAQLDTLLKSLKI
ncbi:nucleoside 2-deoxyribosyltransferase [Candidatus Gottesmanbacteria bacterium]|nr:nucleoside 2-deoxyribosyltransferase [Candidatus Gottesmanbacteria bacterium]